MMGSFPSLNPSLPTSIPGIYEPPASTSGLAAQGSHFLKRGTAAGNYTITGTSFAAIDDTAFKVTVTVPVGILALAWFFCTAEVAGSGIFGAIGVAVDGAISSQATLGSTSVATPFAAPAVALVGDGASHTFAPQALTTNGGFALTVFNDAASDAPTFLVLLLGAT